MALLRETNLNLPNFADYNFYLAQVCAVITNTENTIWVQFSMHLMMCHLYNYFEQVSFGVASDWFYFPTHSSFVLLSYLSQAVLYFPNAIIAEENLLN